MIKYKLTYGIKTYDRDFGENASLPITFDSLDEAEAFKTEFYEFCKGLGILKKFPYTPGENVLLSDIQKLIDEDLIPEFLNKDELLWFDTGFIKLDVYTITKVKHVEEVLEKSR